MKCAHEGKREAKVSEERGEAQVDIREIKLELGTLRERSGELRRHL
jgi:hypothetical protein